MSCGMMISNCDNNVITFYVYTELAYSLANNSVCVKYKPSLLSICIKYYTHPSSHRKTNVTPKPSYDLVNR